MVLLVVLGILLLLIVANIKIVPQSHAFVIERFGSYAGTWESGLHFKMPFIDKIAKKVSLKEQVGDFPPQPVITKDNATVAVDTLVFYQVTDAKLFAYGVENPLQAIGSLSATTLRNILGELELDEALTARDIINTKMRSILDDATDSWGIKVLRSELKSIEPPAQIKDAMEKQMRAEREKRQLVLQSEGRRQSEILVAEGAKAARILNAEAEKEATVLKAEADRIQKIKESEGEAQSILNVQQATAEGLRLLKEAGADSTVVQLKALEALVAAANGQSNTLIIPSEIQNLAGLVKSISTIAATNPAPAALPATAANRQGSNGLAAQRQAAASQAAQSPSRQL